MRDYGWVILDSTDPTFFADPKLSTYEACMKQVPTCDLFVLVIGGRYGETPAGSEKSITNLEYLTAFENEIPIFTFVDDTVWSLLKVWEKSPTADLSAYVDDVRIFSFIDEVRKRSRNNWIWAFREADDIIKILRSQWAHLFQTLLRSERQLEAADVSPTRQQLMQSYSAIISNARHNCDLLGVSLVTIARAPKIGTALNSLAAKNVPTRILLLDPSSKAVEDRASEEYGELNLIDELRGGIEIWRKLTAKLANVSLHIYKWTPKLFLFRSDSEIYVSFYPLQDSAVNAPTFRFDTTTTSGAFFLSQFDALWTESRPL